MKLTSNQKFCSDEEPSHSVNCAVRPLCVHGEVDTECVVSEVTTHCSNGEKRGHVVQLSLPRLHKGDIIVLGNLTNNVVGVSVLSAERTCGRESVVESGLGLRGGASDC